MISEKDEKSRLSLPTKGRVLIRAAKIYDAVQPFVTLGQEAKLNSFIGTYFSEGKKLRILDIGCGTGQMTSNIALKNPGIHITGIDASLPMIQAAERKRAIDKRCTFMQALGEDIPFEDAFFDAAVSSLFFHHVNRGLKLKSLREIYRVLKPGGKLLIADMDRPYNTAGRILSYSAWILLLQPEIKENIDGLLNILIEEAGFINIRQISRFSGYITVTEALKPE